MNGYSFLTGYNFIEMGIDYIYNEIYIYMYVYILYIYGHTDSYHPLNPNMGWIA